MADNLPVEVARLRRELSQVKKGQRISHGASIENAQVTVNDDAGSLRTVLGPLGDGTVGVMAVNGPPPPEPSAPIVASVLGGVSVGWDGQFANGAVIPLDWQRIEVHASILAVYEPSPATLQQTIETAQGATVIVPSDTAVYVRLLARSASGTASVASATVGPFGPAPVVATDILNGIVTTVKLADDAITAAKVAVNAIDSAAIQDSAVIAGKIGAAAVIAGKLAAAAVTSTTIADDAVTAGKVAADAITAREITAGSVNTAELAAGAVTATQIAASTITAGNMAANSVTATQIAAGSVQTAALAADSVAAGKIAADAVTTREIAALTIAAGDIAANAITVGKLAAGSVDATAIAADAITGKTITGGTITGSLVQTAATGERITLNESSANKVLVYNSSGVAIGELSAQGLLVKGTTGAVISLNPNATYPNLAFWNAAGTKAAVIEVTEPVTGDANLEMLSGPFSGSGYTNVRWRTYLSRDSAVIERYNQGGANPKIGGRLFLNDTYGNLGYINDDDTTQSTGLTVQANLATLSNGRLAVVAPASANSGVYVEAVTAHTGNLLRLYRDTDKFKVDKDGNTTAAGTLSASNFPDGAWQDWTPTWTTSSGSATPSFGNATIVAKYTKIGRTVMYRLEITFGSTTNFGTSPTANDNWRFSAPVTAVGTSLHCGFGEVQDASAAGSGIASRLGTRVRLTSTTTFELETSTGRVDGAALVTPNWGVMDALSPWTWANGDRIAISGFYESAS